MLNLYKDTMYILLGIFISFSFTGQEALKILKKGHQNCGAIKAAFDLDDADYGANIGALRAQIRTAIREARQKHNGKTKEKLIEEGICLNHEHTRQEILWRSQVIRNMINEKNC